MGNTYSGIVKAIDEDFERVQQLAEGPSRDYLVLDQVLQMQNSSESYQVDFTHMGTLFALDRNRDGKFTLEDFHEFASLCKSKAERLPIRHDFKTHIQAFFTLKMWSVVAKEDGEQTFVTWICALFGANSLTASRATKKCSSWTGTFYSQDTIKSLYEILAIKQSYGTSYRDFVYLMQSAGEEQKLMKLKDKQVRHYVHETILEQFARHFIKGFVQLMLELGFDPKIKVT